jgi:hypothetical protein
MPATTGEFGISQPKAESSSKNAHDNRTTHIADDDRNRKFPRRFRSK